MPKNTEREFNVGSDSSDGSDDSVEQQLQRERREHALIDEEKLGMDELEEERLRRDLEADEDALPAKK
jgi:hypothetical protein